MDKYKEKLRNILSKPQTRRFILIALFIIAATIFLVSVFMLYDDSDYRKAQDEYNRLREYSPSTLSVRPTPDPLTPSTTPDTSPDSSPEPSPDPIDTLPQIDERTQKLLDINPDYIGWIEIEGTVIDYPVVQGENNGQYIHTTFEGEDNIAGTIFMDWKNDSSFMSSFSVLYGHNSRDGGMFADLHNYSDEEFLDEFPIITITTPMGEALNYRIFKARLALVTDKLFTLFGKDQKTVNEYFIEHGAPEKAENFIVLSTCTDSWNDDERLLIFAAME